MYLDQAMYAAGGGLAPLDVRGSDHKIVAGIDKNTRPQGVDALSNKSKLPRERRVTLG